MAATREALRAKLLLEFRRFCPDCLPSSCQLHLDLADEILPAEFESPLQLIDVQGDPITGSEKLVEYHVYDTFTRLIFREHEYASDDHDMYIERRSEGFDVEFHAGGGDPLLEVRFRDAYVDVMDGCGRRYLRISNETGRRVDLSDIEDAEESVKCVQTYALIREIDGWLAAGPHLTDEAAELKAKIKQWRTQPMVTYGDLIARSQAEVQRVFDRLEALEIAIRDKGGA